MTTKALVLDIDGTLTNSKKEITPATKAAIQELMQQGHKVILASGRPTPGMRRYEEELELFRTEWNFSEGETADKLRREIDRLRKLQ